jgi:hypothetical protein
LDTRVVCAGLGLVAGAGLMLALVFVRQRESSAAEDWPVVSGRPGVVALEGAVILAERGSSFTAHHKCESCGHAQDTFSDSIPPVGSIATGAFMCTWCARSQNVRLEGVLR